MEIQLELKVSVNRINWKWSRLYTALNTMVWMAQERGDSIEKCLEDVKTTAEEIDKNTTGRVGTFLYFIRKEKKQINIYNYLQEKEILTITIKYENS